MHATPVIIDVAIPLPLEQTYSYAVPPELAERVLPGVRVLVPFGRRTVTGYVLGLSSAPPPGEMKEIIELLDREPLFTPADIDLYRWIAAYYLHPLGEVIRTALPAGLTVMGRRHRGVAPDGSIVAEEVVTRGVRCKEERHYLPCGQEPPASLKGKSRELLEFITATGVVSATGLRLRFGACSANLQRLADLGLVRAETREVYRDPFHRELFERDTPHELNGEQSAALAAVTAAADRGGFAPFLLHGVTGSGKTEVYLQAIAHVLELGRSALVLVPEIALTPQLVGRFRRRFSCGIAVLHSSLSPGERYDEWRRIRRGEATIVIGARSAIFAPLEGLGMIIVDEEHEATYKQGDGLRYNARDLALVLGQQRGAVVMLGSATPLVTSVHAARSGKLGELILSSRVNDRPMPETILLDQRGAKKESLLPRLATAIEENLASGGQTLLFLNRRGFATWLACRDCGEVLRCPNCSVTLTYHQQRRRHICHYCDYSVPAPSVCPACDGGEIGLFGLGTERLEEEVGLLFPGARVARMDRDTTSGKGGHSRILKKLENGEIDILIGTQMIAKGHDFPRVTLVGVISADTTLNLPDFRGGERAFQLVSQVLGRAGRGEQAGRVLVQTLSPEHVALTTAVSHDYEGFYREEVAQRQDAGYPPFSYLAALHFSAISSQVVEGEATRAGQLLRELRRQLGVRVEILGPSTAPLGKVRGRHRWQLLLKAPERGGLRRLLLAFKGAYLPPATLRMAIDIDPLELL
jgi:primosomal protein N' (replication factor Y)